MDGNRSCPREGVLDWLSTPVHHGAFIEDTRAIFVEIRPATEDKAAGPHGSWNRRQYVEQRIGNCQQKGHCLTNQEQGALHHRRDRR